MTVRNILYIFFKLVYKCIKVAGTVQINMMKGIIGYGQKKAMNIHRHFYPTFCLG